MVHMIFRGLFMTIFSNVFESWGYEYSNLVNVDWYHPKYCWRHSEDEIRSWCSEFNLSIRYIKELESGYACHVVKTSSII